MRLDGSAVSDWRHTGVHPRYGVRLESATLATHVYVPAHMIAATDAARTAPVGGRGGGEPVDHPPVQAPAPATIAAGESLANWTNSPAARSTDPATSHAAASAVTEQARRDIHRQVLAILAEGPASDFDLAARTDKLATSVGKRRHELCELGLVEQHDRDGVSATGSSCLRWRLTDAGWAAA